MALTDRGSFFSVTAQARRTEEKATRGFYARTGILVAGSTASPDFTLTSNALERNRRDSFLLKLNPTATGLLTVSPAAVTRNDAFVAKISAAGIRID